MKYLVALPLLLVCRKRELLDSKWAAFDQERRTWYISIPKSGKPRNAPLSLAALAVLGQLRRWAGCPYVLPNPKTRLPFGNLYVAWDTARKKVGLPEARTHDLRHTFASNLVNSGRSIFEVSKLLGHTNTRTSERYSHLSDQTLLSAVDAAANAMGASWIGAT